MSYRTWANDYQIFDNNDYSEELINELKRQGMNAPNDDGIYDFEIKDINPIIKIIDEFFQQEISEREKRGVKMYDFKDHRSLKQNAPLYSRVQDLIENCVIFQSYVFVDYLLKTGCIERMHNTSENPVYKIVKPITISAG